MATFFVMSRVGIGSHLRNVFGRRLCRSVSVRNLSNCTVRRSEFLAPRLRDSTAFVSRRHVVEAATADTDVGYDRQNVRRPLWPVQNAGAENTVQGMLQILDSQVRRWSRVDREQVQQVLDLVSNAGTITSEQAMMLIRCTGALLVKESPAERIELCQKVRDAIDATGLEFNTQMFNALLRVMLENGQSFSPAEMLNDMEVNRKLVPNMPTYHLLLSQFCENGDVEGASKILKHMKSLNLTVNELTFNALVKGHVRNGDYAGAAAVMESMRQAGLDPTADTYTVLMSGMAESGDINGINKTISEARQDDVIIAPRHIYSIVVTLANSGHAQHISSMLEYINQMGGMQYNQDALNAVFKLVAGGHDDAAFDVYMTMDRSNYVGQESKLGNILLRCMILKGRPVDAVFSMWKRMRALNLATEAPESIANWALKYQPSDYAVQVFDKMKEMGCEMKRHYFWPIIVDAAKHKELDAVVEALRRFVAISSADDYPIIGDIHRWAIQPLVKRGYKVADIFPKLKELGLHDTDIERLHLTVLIDEGKLADVTARIENDSSFSLYAMKMKLAKGFVASKCNAEDLVKLLQVLATKSEKRLTDLNSAIFLELLENNLVQKSDLEKLISAWTNGGLMLNGYLKNEIEDHLTGHDISEELIRQLDPLFEKGVVGASSRFSTSRTLEDMKDSSIEQLESWLETASDRESKRIQKWLLSKYVQHNMTDKVEELKASMDATGFIHNADALRGFGVMAAQKGNLEEALHYQNEIESQFPDYDRYTVLVLHIARLHLAGGKFSDAISTLKNYVDRKGSYLHDIGYADGYLLAAHGVQLLQTCCEHNDLPQTLELLDLLFDSGYVKPGTYSLLDAIIEGYVTKGDVSACIAALEHCVKKYNRVPGMQKIFKLLIEQENATQLQTAVDYMSSVQGEMVILLRLSAAFVECGKIKQARRILETPGLRAVMRPLVECCQHFYQQNMDKELEKFVEITKNLFAVERDEMLFQLIRLHAKTRDTKKIMEIYSRFEEEAIVPKPGIVRYVAKVLQACGEPVPFDVPGGPLEQSDMITRSRVKGARNASVVASTMPMRTKPLSPMGQELLEKAINSNDVSDLVEFAVKPKEDSADAKADSIVDVAQELVRRDERLVIRKIFDKLVENADIKSLESLTNSANLKTLHSLAARTLCLVYLQSGKVKEVVAFIKKHPDQLMTYFSIDNLITVMREQPAIFKELEDMLMVHAMKADGKRASCHLHDLYVISGQMQKVKELLQKHPKFKNDISPRNVGFMLRNKEREDTLVELIDLYRSEKLYRELKFVYNILISLKCKQNDFSAALGYYNSALGDQISFTNIWLENLKSMQNLATTHGQSVPWQPEMLSKRLDNKQSDSPTGGRQQQKRMEDTSSSDSSSDSDAEKVEKKP